MQRSIAAKVLVAGAAALGSILITGCAGYGKVSPATYQYAKALYSISNRRAEHKLDDVDAKIEAARGEGLVSDREAQWLSAIVADARAGEWETANRAARRMLEDQVQ
jgi:hypothetical protein